MINKEVGNVHMNKIVLKGLTYPHYKKNPHSYHERNAMLRH